jgi:hypothetical protein
MSEPLPKPPLLLGTEVKMTDVHGDTVHFGLGWEFQGFTHRIHTYANYVDGQTIYEDRRTLVAYAVRKASPEAYETENIRLCDEHGQMRRMVEQERREFAGREEQLQEEIGRFHYKIEVLETEKEYIQAASLRFKNEADEARKNASLREKDLFKVRDFLGSKQFNEIVGEKAGG